VCTMSNPLPSDLGSVWKMDGDAEEPRPRRPDEVTDAGNESKQDYFLIHPSIGVSSHDRFARWSH
jgi:hypothetical protein